MNNPLSICVGKCLICGKMIEVIPRRGSSKFTNIFICPSCEIKVRAESKYGLDFDDYLMMENEEADK